MGAKGGKTGARNRDAPGALHFFSTFYRKIHHRVFFEVVGGGWGAHLLMTHVINERCELFDVHGCMLEYVDGDERCRILKWNATLCVE